MVECCVMRVAYYVVTFHAARNTWGASKTAIDCTESNTIRSIKVMDDCSNTCSISGVYKIHFSMLLWYTLGDKNELRKISKAAQYRYHNRCIAAGTPGALRPKHEKSRT
jgi:hypothetical protein